ncbi:MAG: PPC domain-containing protein [Gemmataceae bacterium]|nr:PPC domain-containing protein [Gemmataceae bacterium]
MKNQFLAGFFMCLSVVCVRANPPVASYIFPAGGQRGSAVSVKVGGLFLHQNCGFEMLGPGVQFPKELKRIPTLWLEGPLLPLPDSQRAEDYPKDMAGQVQIAKDAPLGLRYWRLWTSQGATPSKKFVVGDLPEVVEEEIDGDPVPVKVTTPVTINGRMFPREDVDVWTFTATKGQGVWCEVNAARLGSPLTARLELRDSQGRRQIENNDAGGPDPRLRFVAPADGEYQLHITDVQYQGGQAYVYRLTVTAEPMIERAFPLGGKRGSAVQLALSGQNVPARPVTVAIPANAAESFAHQYDAAGKRSNTILLDVDDLPEVNEGPPAPRAVPAIFNGRIDVPGEVDVWTFTAKKGKNLEIDLRAGRLGSRLDGIITVHDVAGKQLARAEATGKQLDPTLSFAPPADGAYTVKVQDRFRSRGGPEFAYRLRIARPAAPDYHLHIATDPRNPALGDAITVPRKGQSKLKINAERIGGFKEPITLTVDGLPAGVTVAPTTLAAGQTSVELTFKAADDAKIVARRIRIHGTAKWKGQDARRAVTLPGNRGEPGVDDVLLAVALPTPFVIKGEYDMGFAPRGSLHERKYKIERNGFDGPIEVSLTDRQARHLQGVTGPTIVVPAGVSEFTYAAMFPPWMDQGRTSRTCVMGVGVVKDKDKSEHRVCFSSVNQNEQLVAVVGPGQLALELERTSCAAAPGQPAAIPLRVKRAMNMPGAVKVELIAPAHIRGVTATPVTLAADQDRGQLTLQFAAKLDGPFNMPLTVRATLMHDHRPVIAEQKLDVQP